MLPHPDGSVPGELDSTSDQDGTRDQAAIREVNNQLSAMATSSADLRLLVICECADVRCSAPLTVLATEYEHVRRFPARFIVKPGHVAPDVERIAHETEEFFVVEKIGEAATIADRRHPRRHSH